MRTLCPGFTTDPDQNLHSQGTYRKTALIDRALAGLSVDIAALQETRLAGSGSVQEQHYTFFWSGKPENERRIHGVGFAVANKLVKNIDTPVSISERLTHMTLKQTTNPTHLICAYAPTLDSGDTIKDQFYERLADILGRIPCDDQVVLLGDFNARVGADHSAWPDVIGHYGVGRVNSNGERVLELCSQYGLCIGNTWFKQKERRRVTWRHPRSRMWHQLDLVMVRRRTIGQVRFSRTYHSADGDTDHSLVLTELYLAKRKLVPRQSRQSALRLDVTRMKCHENVQKFRGSFEEKVRAGATPEGSEDSWVKLRTAMLEAATEAFGTKRPLKEDWMAASAATLEPLLVAKNEAHRMYKAEATESSLYTLKAAKRQLQKTTRYCANQYWNQLCDEMSRASDTGNLRDLYRGLKKAIGPTVKKVCPLKAADGTLITDLNQQMARWVEHYSELYGQERSITAAALASVPHFSPLDELDAVPNLSELQNALHHTSLGKSPGLDGISADLLKCDNCLLSHMYELLCNCWRVGSFPADMKVAKIVTLYKGKGDKGECNSYRGISLLSVLGKVFARVLLPRLQELANQVYPESQCGFRGGRSTADMIFTVRQVQEKCREQNRPLHIAFVDLTKAFDLVSREGLFAILQRIGCPSRLLSLIRSLHDDMTAAVHYEGSTSECFNVRSGVKQGCVLAPTLFGIFFSLLLHHAFGNHEDEDDVFLHTRSDGKLFNLARLRAKTKVRQVLVRELLFADDAALVSHSAAGLHRLLERFRAACSEFALIISIKKTVVMHQNGIPGVPVAIGGRRLEAVDQFTYLGSNISSNLSVDKEVQSRIGKAASVFGRLRHRAWRNKHLTIRTRARIYECCVVSVLLYGAETWTTYARHEKKLNAFHMRCLRSLLGVTWRDKVSNEDVLRRTGCCSLYQTLKRRRLRWLGHLRRMPDGRLPKDVLYGELRSGERSRGRPLLRFKDVVKRDMLAMDIAADTWEQLAEDRAEWRCQLRDGGARLDAQWLRALARKRGRVS